MKINILTPHLNISGGVMILATYAHRLTLLGHEVKLLTVNPVFWRRCLANLLKQKPSWTGGMNFEIERIADLKEHNLGTADILLVSTYKHANAIKNLSDQCGKKVYLLQHDERLYHGAPEEVSEAYKLPFKFIAVSSWIKDWLKKDFNQDAELILNTLDKNIFYPHKTERKDKDIRILMLHHSYEWKGTAEGVKIVNELKEKYNNVKLIMYGARQEKVQCDEYHYKPFGIETAKLFSSCDIFLCSSWDEGFGLPSLEAMACGCAVVTYDNGGSRDFAFDGSTALVAERRNIEESKNKLEILIKDKNLRKNISEAGVQFVKEMPDWRDQVGKMEKILLSKM
ncbi:MAG: Glycosyl transferase group 1 [Candidatus Falkowbacteria bacterium GW2011_GWC2_38_22]|uniref:Glycosyl transferase group 1 n=1 Tax=Candidatus Falkowbacteria bacterium GW2011_GWE1_38_31 TaxID=1618638 RepID=A0A0G0JUR1_9BACT|nr:MAG: Glycosyl transferase group 1 [Candidatus Falkowbacteria bacterium GW2011_GWF2_38_1205]KKQ61849.1 MAG: Glycosyl transferase group 1 [Candidatus Falkowbacteria bacterium GW2011_GWC2_38_22]KKQ64157.1 MAG: Glycosyl transferase group 1 [Candidatus Falkowbacteria bacterium GW2011_GWF1_38_22]KKQ66493.1 MAG: Glycosyl transferase group 1 [Candidatus Falkowbacteria bacterium GW2011_GWE2_38_254]KKQ71263.1 MAG: Glycosyl transferase group 1 [Candidatus Falkowbacteria bacterium GW2011_GWE1_38_31]KKQ